MQSGEIGGPQNDRVTGTTTGSALTTLLVPLGTTGNNQITIDSKLQVSTSYQAGANPAGYNIGGRGSTTSGSGSNNNYNFDLADSSGKTIQSGTVTQTFTAHFQPYSNDPNNPQFAVMGAALSVQTNYYSFVLTGTNLQVFNPDGTANAIYGATNFGGAPGQQSDVQFTFTNIPLALAGNRVSYMDALTITDPGNVGGLNNIKSDSKATGLNFDLNETITSSVVMSPPIPTIGDPGFESPSVGSGGPSYVYNPTSTPWTFTGGSGISGNGSGFTARNPNAPEGQQVAFLQDQSAISQSVPNWAAGTYALSFDAAERATNGSASTQAIQVLVDGTVVATIQPGSASYQVYTTPSFTVSAGTHTIAFDGTSGGNDYTAFIDNITIAASSSPATALKPTPTPPASSETQTIVLFGLTGSQPPLNRSNGVATNLVPPAGPQTSRWVRVNPRVAQKPHLHSQV